MKTIAANGWNHYLAETQKLISRLNNFKKTFDNTCHFGNIKPALRDRALKKRKDKMNYKKYSWSFTTFCGEHGSGKASNMKEVVEGMRQIPLLPEDWIQFINVWEENDADFSCYRIFRSNYDERFESFRGVAPEFDKLIDY